MSKLLIAGIGDVLLGDDGIGPFIIKVLTARYDFPENVEFADFGTHPLELPLHVSRADTVILVNAIAISFRIEAFPGSTLRKDLGVCAREGAPLCHFAGSPPLLQRWIPGKEPVCAIPQMPNVFCRSSARRAPLR
jgi:hypothetical protein